LENASGAAEPLAAAARPADRPRFAREAPPMADEWPETEPRKTDDISRRPRNTDVVVGLIP
jgi:hypothetical protein